ncbi:Histone H4 [Fusarium oxysporum f. sp. albedinis]|nr:Histone H4 [Fusarium oxysporum f. sp. albedinis]
MPMTHQQQKRLFHLQFFCGRALWLCQESRELDTRPKLLALLPDAALSVPLKETDQECRSSFAPVFPSLCCTLHDTTKTSLSNLSRVFRVFLSAITTGAHIRFMLPLEFGSASVSIIDYQVVDQNDFQDLSTFWTVGSVWVVRHQGSLSVSQLQVREAQLLVAASD